ncbi:formimidoylglutamate deiminase [Piscinibacter sp.]|jgi:formimidoylglutamate deiminase|uniref:formimidoylglutamate deiminase n=1 Tax=Piscinibacter sp. TaxID=1903157 RepID=UPI002F3F65EE
MNESAAADTRRALLAPHALLPSGWARDVRLSWDERGMLTAVAADTPHADGVERSAGIVIPGMPNLHSHAFQRAFAGLTEMRSASDDSFWSWRDHMYRFAAALTPDALEDIATQLYIEMLRAGYTSVCEFHYLHHDPQGRPYAEPAEMSLRLASAAQRAGIGLTLLPVLYQASGFGAAPPLPQQQRFVTSVDALLAIVQRLRSNGIRAGVAPHSLRAVPPAALNEVVQGLHAIDARAPVHIHIAEQQREVDDCVAWSGQRPVQWLLANARVDARWCLVHATHMSDDESRALAASGAVAGLCPSTEANLGDGVFDASAYVGAGGHWGIGSDSHATLSVAEELRWLEYTQRLALRRRNVLATAARPGVAENLWLGAVDGGARASGAAIAGLVAGQSADFVVLDAGRAMQGLAPAQRLASHVFASHPDAAVRQVWVGGRCRVSDGDHALGAQACERFVAARDRLLNEA